MVLEADGMAEAPEDGTLLEGGEIDDEDDGAFAGDGSSLPGPSEILEMVDSSVGETPSHLWYHDIIS